MYWAREYIQNYRGVNKRPLRELAIRHLLGLACPEEFGTRPSIPDID